MDYEKLLNIYERVKEKEVKKIPEDFYTDALNYIKELETNLSKSSISYPMETKDKYLVKEYLQAKDMLNAIINRRTELVTNNINELTKEKIKKLNKIETAFYYDISKRVKIFKRFLKNEPNSYLNETISAKLQLKYYNMGMTHRELKHPKNKDDKGDQ